MLAEWVVGLVRRPNTAKVVTMRYGLPEEKPPAATIEVVMLRDAKGCPDGFTTTAYAKGRRYHLPESLARSFFSSCAADPAEAHEGLDAGSEQTHAEAAEAATEDSDETGGSPREDDEPAAVAQPERRPRRPRRVHG